MPRARARLPRLLRVGPEEYSMVILDSKSAVCIDTHGKDNKHNRQNFRIVHDVKNGEKCKILTGVRKI